MFFRIMKLSILGRAVPLLTVVMAFIFCLVNGFMQSLFVLSGNLLFSNNITGIIQLPFV